MPRMLRLPSDRCSRVCPALGWARGALADTARQPQLLSIHPWFADHASYTQVRAVRRSHVVSSGATGLRSGAHCRFSGCACSSWISVSARGSLWCVPVQLQTPAPPCSVGGDVPVQVATWLLTLSGLALGFPEPACAGKRPRPSGTVQQRAVGVLRYS